jgi:protein gp37
MENSKIEWTDHTFNPWEGCTKVSPGCANCYAETRNARFYGKANPSGAAPNWGKGAPRRRTSAANWRKPLAWDRHAGAELLTAQHILADEKAGEENRQWAETRRRPRVFSASLADWLDDEVPLRWLADLLDLIRQTPSLDWQLLTKRPQNWETRMRQVWTAFTGCQDDTVPFQRLVDSWLQGTPPPNVWIGTTVEDQTRADERIPQLLRIPARIRFLSCEPLLGRVDLSAFMGKTVSLDDRIALYNFGIDWVIAGGESGPRARPMHPEWARSLRDQCAANKVPFFLKQWGEWAPDSPFYPGPDDDDPFLDGCIVLEPSGSIVHDSGDRLEYQPAPGSWLMRRLGKKSAARLLHGRTYDDFPTSRI